MKQFSHIFDVFVCINNHHRSWQWVSLMDEPFFMQLVKIFDVVFIDQMLFSSASFFHSS